MSSFKQGNRSDFSNITVPIHGFEDWIYMCNFSFVKNVTYYEAHTDEFPKESLELVSEVSNHFVSDIRGASYFVIRKRFEDCKSFIISRGLHEIGIILVINVFFQFI